MWKWVISKIVVEGVEDGGRPGRPAWWRGRGSGPVFAAGLILLAGAGRQPPGTGGRGAQPLYLTPLSD